MPTPSDDVSASHNSKKEKKTKKEKTPKITANKVGTAHEALRVPMLNSRGREVVGNPAVCM